MNSLTHKKITGLILAAGKSGRVGEPKAFLKLNDKTFITEIILKLSSFCHSIIVVFGFDGDMMKIKLLSDEKLKSIIEKIQIEINIHYEAGMFSSLQCGLKKIKNSDFILIHQVDQPSLPLKFYEEFLKQADEEIDWFQPSFEGKVGHPILISKKLAEEILIEDTNSNLREFKKKKALKQKIWECSFPEIHQDIDTIEDYDKLIKELQNEHI